MDPITFKDGSVLKIIADESPESPREWNNNGTMVCFHRQYNLGDKHDYKQSDFSIAISAGNGWDALRVQIEKDHDDVVILPLYLFDHSGLSIATDDTKFRQCDRAGWDWGQVGFIFATRENLKKGGHPDNVDPVKVETWLRGEVEIYDQFLRGDIFGFTLRAPPTHCDACSHDEEGEVTDSCWGFYGDDPVENGMIDHLSEPYRTELKVLESA